MFCAYSSSPTYGWADRITLGSLGDSFAAARDAVGLPKELGLHCLRTPTSPT
jgi:hypothetical protein